MPDIDWIKVSASLKTEHDRLHDGLYSLRGSDRQAGAIAVLILRALYEALNDGMKPK